ncbi:MAG: phage holin [Lactobacillaceae bacterium]|nr:phage holin [Lactobacillaceae bacterium]
MDQLIKILVALFDSGLLGAVTVFGVKYLISITKNKNILMFEKWALQAVTLADKTTLENPEKKDLATNFLTERLNANKLNYKFSEDQVSAAIELALKELKGNN